MRHSRRKRAPVIRLFATLLPICVVLASCTVEHGQRTARRYLEQTPLVARHEVIRSADWTLSSRTRLCQLPALVEGASAAAHAERVSHALMAALRQSFVVEVPGGEAVDASALPRCAVWVRATVLEVGEDRERRKEGEPLTRELVVRVTLHDALNIQLLDVALIRSRAGAVTPVASLPEAFVMDAMQAYVARIASTPPG